LKYSLLSKWLPSSVVAFVVVVAVCVATVGCAGYQIGSRSMFRPDVQTVYVPVFESSGFRRHVSEQLTEAVIKRMEQVTPYKSVSAENADSVLLGRVGPVSKRAITIARTGDPREIEVAMQVQVQWNGRSGEPLMQPTSMPISALTTEIRQDSPFFPEAGQSLATAKMKAIDQLAAEIVEQMELGL